jgi:hypothetical protein
MDNSASPTPASLLTGAAFSFCALIAAAPWLINKRPGAQPTDAHPLVVWALLVILLGAASHSGPSRMASALLLVVSASALVPAPKAQPSQNPMQGPGPHTQ